MGQPFLRPDRDLSPSRLSGSPQPWREFGRSRSHQTTPPAPVFHTPARTAPPTPCIQPAGRHRAVPMERDDQAPPDQSPPAPSAAGSPAVPPDASATALLGQL